jgi:hypothetical protein
LLRDRAGQTRPVQRRPAGGIGQPGWARMAVPRLIPPSLVLAAGLGRRTGETNHTVDGTQHGADCARVWALWRMPGGPSPECSRRDERGDPCLVGRKSYEDTYRTSSPPSRGTGAMPPEPSMIRAALAGTSAGHSAAPVADRRASAECAVVRHSPRCVGVDAATEAVIGPAVSGSASLRCGASAGTVKTRRGLA